MVPKQTDNEMVLLVSMTLYICQPLGKGRQSALLENCECLQTLMLDDTLSESLHALLFMHVKDVMKNLLNPLSAKHNNAEFANTVDPDETAHNEPSHQDLQCLPFSL